MSEGGGEGCTFLERFISGASFFLKDSIKKSLSAASRFSICHAGLKLHLLAIYKQYACFMYNVDLILKKIYCINAN